RIEVRYVRVLLERHRARAGAVTAVLRRVDVDLQGTGPGRNQQPRGVAQLDPAEAVGVAGQCHRPGFADLQHARRRVPAHASGAGIRSAPDGADPRIVVVRRRVLLVDRWKTEWDCRRAGREPAADRGAVVERQVLADPRGGRTADLGAVAQRDVAVGADAALD